MQENFDSGAITPTAEGSTLHHAVQGSGDRSKKIEAITIALMFCMGAFISDRIFKYLIMNDLFPTQVLRPGFLAIVKHYNHGLLANFPMPLAVSVAINLVALAVLVYALVQSVKNVRAMECQALGFLLGGALGNLFDRLVFGYVFDWMMWFNTSIINFADVYIATGIGLYLWAHSQGKGES